MKKLLLLSGIITIVISCKKDSVIDDLPNPKLSIIPQITLTNYAPATVKEFEDSLIFYIQYKDGDGDIGFENADSAALYLTDNRAGGLTEGYHISPRTDIGDSVAIQGTLKLILSHTFILGNSASETTTYTIQIRDRAGHWSNKVTSGTITINK